MLSPIEGPDGANLQKNTKSWRKILMTKPGFEPRSIEMEVGRSMTYTIRTPEKNVAHFTNKFLGNRWD
jgi:hypothetical protein